MRWLSWGLYSAFLCILNGRCWCFLVLIFIVKVYEISMEVSFVEGGVYPRRISGLKGILFSPAIHGNWKHLLDNSMPVFFLSLALFFFYRDIAYKIWILIYVVAGILLWAVGRQAYHIGASGIIYGLATFLFVSGIIRKVRALMAIALLVVFWYGGLVWGLLPFDFEVSFEAHLTGAISGVVLAIVYRDQGPEPEPSTLDDEDENEDGDEVPDETNPETDVQKDQKDHVQGSMDDSTIAP